MSTTITPNAHERAEWARLAADAYRTGRNFYGHRYSAASARPGPVALPVFDTLQTVYRVWLNTGWSGVEGGAR